MKSFIRTIALISTLSFSLMAQGLEWAIIASDQGSDFSFTVNDSGRPAITGLIPDDADPADIVVNFLPGTPQAESLQGCQSSHRYMYFAQLNEYGGYEWGRKVPLGPTSLATRYWVDFGPGGYALSGTFGPSMSFEADDCSLSDQQSTILATTFITAFSENGTPRWIRIPNSDNGGDVASGSRVAVDNQGNVFLICDKSVAYGPWVFGEGGPNETAVNGLGAVLAKYAADGSFLWAEKISEGLQSGNTAYIDTDQSGNVIVAQYYQSTFESPNLDVGGSNITIPDRQFFYIAEFSGQTGAINWHYFPEEDSEATSVTLSSIVVDESGSTYFCGAFYGGDLDFSAGESLSPKSSDEDHSEGFVAKLNSSGTISWANSIRGTGAEFATSIDADDESAFVTGTASSGASFGSESLSEGIYVARVLSNGNVEWATTVASGESDDPFIRLGRRLQSPLLAPVREFYIGSSLQNGTLVVNNMNGNPYTLTAGTEKSAWLSRFTAGIGDPPHFELPWEVWPKWLEECPMCFGILVLVTSILSIILFAIGARVFGGFRNTKMQF